MFAATTLPLNAHLGLEAQNGISFDQIGGGYGENRRGVSRAGVPEVGLADCPSWARPEGAKPRGTSLLEQQSGRVPWPLLLPSRSAFTRRSRSTLPGGGAEHARASAASARVRGEPLGGHATHGYWRGRSFEEAFTMISSGMYYPASTAFTWSSHDTAVLPDCLPCGGRRVPK